MMLDRLVELTKTNASFKLSDIAQVVKLSQSADENARYIAQHLDERYVLLSF